MSEKAKEIRRAEKLKKQMGGGGISSANAISANSISQHTMAVKDFGISTGGSSVSLSELLSSGKISGIATQKPTGGGRALKLGQKSVAEDVFLQQLASEDKGVALSDKKVCAKI
jgi:hypothetical protein